ncbi:MAG: hypothetical protein HQK98_06540 [Nitrospirae bacterium]|nr:hypothetical protein [Nitrospirota bacterium]
MPFNADNFNSSLDLFASGDGTYGNWKVVNTAHATGIDINSTNPGYLSIYPTGVSAPTGSTFTVPFVYQDISGDFDIHFDTNSASYGMGLVAYDPVSSAGGVDWVGVVNNPGGDIFASTTNSSTVTNPVGGSSFSHFRLTRVGNVFTGYISSDGSSWSACSTTYTSTDFNTSIRVGIIAWNSTAIDTWDGTSSGVPSTTMDISMSLPMFKVSDTGTQTGNFMDIGFPKFGVDIELVPEADISMALPLFDIDIETVTTERMDIGLSLPRFKVSGDVIAGSFNQIDIGLPMFTVYAETAAYAELALPIFGVNATVLTGAVSNANIGFPKFGVSIDAVLTALINADISMPMFGVDIDLNRGVIASSDLSLPRFGVDASGFAGSLCDMSMVLPVFSVDGNSYQSIFGNSEFSLPMFIVEGVVVSDKSVIVNGKSLETFMTVVINTTTKAVSFYKGFDFNSYGRPDSFTHLAANSSGIYEIDGDMDDGQPINCMMMTGINDFGIDNLKQCLEAYFHAPVATSAPVLLKVIADDGPQRTYTIIPGQRTSRVVLSRGDIGRHWEFKVEGVAPLEINSMKAAVTPLRRIR